MHYVSLSLALVVLNRPVTAAAPDWTGTAGLRWDVVYSPIATTTPVEMTVIP